MLREDHLLYIDIVADHVRKRARSCSDVRCMLVDVRALEVTEQNLLFILPHLLLPPLFILPPRILDHPQNLPSVVQFRRHRRHVTSFAVSRFSDQIIIISDKVDVFFQLLGTAEYLRPGRPSHGLWFGLDNCSDNGE